jgi:hypothetical protein
VRVATKLRTHQQTEGRGCAAQTSTLTRSSTLFLAYHSHMSFESHQNYLNSSYSMHKNTHVIIVVGLCLRGAVVGAGYLAWVQRTPKKHKDLCVVCANAHILS